EGKLAYQNNQTDRAIQIALKASNIVGNLSSLQQELIMEAVAQYPGVNITLYQNGLSSFNSTLNEIQKRWLTVELTLFDETETLFSISPPGGELGDVIYIKGNLTLPGNGSGVPDASLSIKIDNEVAKISTDKNGKYNFTYKISNKKPGVYPVQVNFVPVNEPLLESSARGSFFIKQTNTTLTIKANPDHGRFGDILNLSGRLVARNSSGVADADIVIKLDNKTLANVKTDEKGLYDHDFKIQGIAEGEHIVKLDFISSDPLLLQSSNTTAIKVIPENTTLTIKADPDRGKFGDILTLSGSLVMKNSSGITDADIVIKLDNKTPVNVKTDEKGLYQYNFNVPAMAEGEHVVNAEFIPSEQPLFRSGNKTIITLMQTATTIIISGAKIAYQQDYLNLTGKLLTDKNLEVPNARVSTLLDEKEVGAAVVTRGDFFFSFWIDKNTSLGNHTVTVKFTGDSPFLPSENSISVEIIAKPEHSRNILFLILGAISIIIIFYLRKELSLWIDALASAIKVRIGSGTKTETPPITHEPLKEAEIKQKPEETAVQVQEQDMLIKVYAHLENLIEQKQFKESILYSYKDAKDCVSTYSGIKSAPQQTHWEFYNIAKSSMPAVADDFLKLTELYETAMYSSRKMDAEQAVKAVDLLRKIHNLSNEKNK
ncbi:MAG: DUF4129 domain-containing protein, partial [Candidatus Methanoperedens sp.]|nr:DUF4129 domain-containing protein [Candidatus Methanoperedens sp.]